MRLAETDRARVPFAVVAVVLLVGSATLATTMHGRQAGGATSDTRVAVERASGAAQTAVSAAVDRAARDAARTPVVTPANTTYGRVIDPETPFRDYLRIRIYLAARESLRAVGERVGDVHANASLAPVRDADDLRRAKEAVDLRATNGTIGVRLRNVTVRATRGNRTLYENRTTVRVAVENPAVALHDRVARFEDRLDRGPLEGPGLGRRLAGRLYAVAWARGYAQYGGAPVERVVGNRHVEVLTNGAILDTQRATFGGVDPAGKRAARRATVRVSVKDLLAATGKSGEWIDTLFGTRGTEGSGVPGYRSGGPPGYSTADDPSPEGTTAVGVDHAADRALETLLSGDGSVSLDRILRTTYAANATVTATVDSDPAGNLSPPAPPGEGWELLDERVERSLAVERGKAPPAPTPGGWHRHATHERRVEEQWSIERTWVREGENRTTTATGERTHRVGLALVDRHAPSRFAPDRPIDHAHERGGPLDGRNLRGIPDRAVERLVAARGGTDELAKRAVRNELAKRAVRDELDDSVRIRGDPPDDLSKWIYRDLATLRDRVRNVSVEVQRSRLATGTNPYRRLATRIRDVREDLVDAPATYRSVADKVRVASRAAYVEAVVDELERRADEADDAREGTDDALADRGAPGLDRIRQVIGLRDDSPPGEGSIPAPAGDGPIPVAVDGGPSYLPLANLTGDRVPAVAPDERFHGLVARTRTVFAYPYAEAAGGAIERILGSGDRVDLRTAAKTLQGANTADASTTDENVSALRDRLAGELDVSLDRTRGRATWVVAAETDLPADRAREAVEEGLAPWDTTAERVLAASNGSAAPAIAGAVERRTDLTAVERDRLAVRLRVVLREGTEAANGLSTDVVTPAAERVQTLASDRLSEAVGTRVENATERLGDRWFGSGSMVPVGLPLLPTPGYWYATANVWHVEVGGTYARFAVRSPRGGPTDDGRVAYVRDGSSVRLDVDDDGTPDRLGNASRVSFAVEVPVVVVVPPGKNGVGNTDGAEDQRSPGWPEPGIDRNESQVSDGRAGKP